MAKVEVLTYTENELKAIEILKANAGEHLSAKELGIATAVLTSLQKKAVDPRPMAEGVERITVYKEDYNAVCPECGNKISHKLYWVEA
jgi:hypothetical protein